MTKSTGTLALAQATTLSSSTAPAKTARTPTSGQRKPTGTSTQTSGASLFDLSPGTFESTIDTGGEDTVVEGQPTEESEEEKVAVTGETAVTEEAEQAQQELKE